MRRIVRQLISFSCLAGMAAGCVTFPAAQLGLEREDRPSRRPVATLLTGPSSCPDDQAVPTVRVAMRDLAAALDLLARVDHARPEWKDEVLRELSDTDAGSVHAVVEQWHEKLNESDASEPRQPARKNTAVARTSDLDERETDSATDADENAAAAVQPLANSLFQSRLDRFINGTAGQSHTTALESDGPSHAADDQPADSAGDLPSWDDLMQALAARTRERAGGSDAESSLARVHAALLELVWQSGQGTRPHAAPDPELWHQLAPAVEVALGSASAPRSPQEVIESLQVATELLRGPDRFQVRGLTFCRRIRGYDNIERLETTTFAAGQSLLVYSEVEHFFSEPTDVGFRTKLSSTLELTGPSGQSAWRQEFAAVEDISDAPRRDFFMSHSFRLPPSLKPGRHNLRLTLRDELANRTASTTIALTVR